MLWEGQALCYGKEASQIGQDPLALNGTGKMKGELSWGKRGEWDSDSVVPQGSQEDLSWQQWKQLSGGNEITSLILTHFLKLQNRNLNSANLFLNSISVWLDQD